MTFYIIQVLFTKIRTEVSFETLTPVNSLESGSVESIMIISSGLQIAEMLVMQTIHETQIFSKTLSDKHVSFPHSEHMYIGIQAYLSASLRSPMLISPARLQLLPFSKDKSCFNTDFHSNTENTQKFALSLIRT